MLRSRRKRDAQEMDPRLRGDDAVSFTQSGFTLVEMSIVLIIVGLLITAVFPALTALRTNAQQNLTNSNLQTLLRATAVYVQANGCLPCPTPAGTVGPTFGVIGITGNGAACSGVRINGVTSVCSTPEGIPPFASLGLPSATAHDGWGRWITMRVDPTLTSPSNVVIDQSSVTIPPSGSQGLCSSSLTHNTNSISIQTPSGATQKAAVIFVSHGANGYGSFIADALATGLNGLQLPFPTSVSSPCDTTSYEQCNASLSANFVNAPTVHDATGTTTYDDLMTFLDRNNLVALFGTTVCTTTW